jgi:hypothetical protein
VLCNGCFEHTGDDGTGAGAILFDIEPRGVVEMPKLARDELIEQLRLEGTGRANIEVSIKSVEYVGTMNCVCSSVREHAIRSSVTVSDENGGFILNSFALVLKSE